MPESSKWALYLRFPYQNPVCTAHFTLLNFITWITFSEENRSLSSALRRFLHSPGTSSLLGPRILLSTLFSHTLNLHSSLSMNDQVLNPYKTTYISIS
jgi:hypothetical protein